MYTNRFLRNIFLAAALTVGSHAAVAQNDATAVAERPAAAVDLDAKYATALLKCGDEAPEISVKTMDGADFRLSSLRGKYVVLDFWASWCPDCRRDAPAVVALYDKFAAKGVEFVGVSFDKNAQSWRSGVEKLGLRYTQVSDLKPMRESEVAQAYHISWIPTIYIIDPQGKVALATVMSDKASSFLHSVYPDCAE